MQHVDSFVSLRECIPAAAVGDAGEKSPKALKRGLF